MHLVCEEGIPTMKLSLQSVYKECCRCMGFIVTAQRSRTQKQRAGEQMLMLRVVSLTLGEARNSGVMMARAPVEIFYRHADLREEVSSPRKVVNTRALARVPTVLFLCSPSELSQKSTIAQTTHHIPRTSHLDIFIVLESNDAPGSCCCEGVVVGVLPYFFTVHNFHSSQCQ
jgi:hypothetical protein